MSDPNDQKRHSPPLTVPDLPESSGAWLGTRTQILEKDVTFVRTHAEYLDARTAQTSAYAELVLARMRLAKIMAELLTLPELCRREQEHRLRMFALTSEVEATDAATALAAARQRLAQAGGSRPALAEGALTVDDVEHVLSQFPEFDESAAKVAMLLRALAREKST